MDAKNGNGLQNYANIIIFAKNVFLYKLGPNYWFSDGIPFVTFSILLQ